MRLVKEIITEVEDSQKANGEMEDVERVFPSFLPLPEPFSLHMAAICLEEVCQTSIIGYEKTVGGRGTPAHLLPEGQHLQRPGVLHSMTEDGQK